VTAYDVVVVGLGGVGSAAAAALARRGRRVLGLDRYPPAHDRGASHGETRIVRKAYFEGAGYVPLLHRAYELWDELGLLVRTGGLFLGSSDSRVLAGSLATAREWGLPHELLDAAEVAARFPDLTPPAGTVGLLEPDAGFVPPEAAVRAQLARAQAAGAELRHDEPVTGWRAGPYGVTVTTAAGRYDAGTLVVAPGAWAAELLPGLPVPLQVEDRTQYWFTAPPGRMAAGRFPVWIWQLPDGTAAYGAPASSSGVKAAIHHCQVRSAADWTADEVHALLRPLLPGLGALARSARCTYTMTPDEHAVVGRHPDHERVLVACGFSGHGFKLTPVLGEALADLAVDGATRHDLGLLDPLREVVPGRLVERSPTG
jgi:monomeric sarcosine oxidase